MAHLCHLSSIIPYHQQNHSKQLQVASSVINIVTSPHPSHLQISILNLLFPLAPSCIKMTCAVDFFDGCSYSSLENFFLTDVTADKSYQEISVQVFRECDLVFLILKSYPQISLLYANCIKIHKIV